MTDDKNAEIVATCEAAVTHLTVDGSWTQGAYIGGGDVTTWSADRMSFTEDFTKAEACLGGALVLAGLPSKVIVDDTIHWFGSGASLVAQCPAVPAVAAVIREKYPELDPGDDGDTVDESLIYSFNDTPDREIDDVVDVLTETIKRHTDERVA